METARSRANLVNSKTYQNYLFSRIDKIPRLAEARVIYFDGNTMHELRPYPSICQKNYLTVLIRSINKKDAENITTSSSDVKKNDSSFWRELLSSSLSCGAAALSWIVVGGSGAAVPISGGTSSAITVLSYSAATASSLQCVNSSYRLFNETEWGDSEINRQLDSEEWYVHTMAALDAISIAGAGAAATVTLKMTLKLEKSGKSMMEVLRGLSRQERKRLTQDIIRTQNPGISNGALKSLLKAGKYPKRFGKVELSKTVRTQLIDAVGATLSFSGSATSGVIRDPAKLKDIAIAVFEEFEVY